MPFLLFFTTGWLRWAVLAVVLATSFAVYRHSLIQQGRDEILNKMAKEELRVRNLRDGITQSLEAKHAKEVADITVRFDKFIAGLRESGSRPKPIPVTATICNDQAADNRLSDAIADHLAGVRSIIASERAKVAGLGKVAELQTGQLITGQGWLAEQMQVK